MQNASSERLASRFPPSATARWGSRAYTESGFQSMRRRALAAAGPKNLQFRDVRKAAVNEAKKLGRNAQEFAGHSDPRTTEKHYLNEPVVVKPIR